MAGERSENLEELVRRIVHSVNRNETSHSNDNGSILRIRFKIERALSKKS